MNVDDFVGREAEARTLLANVQRGHSTLLVAPAGMGKTALIEFIMPLLAADGKLIETSRVGPGVASFLRDLFTGLHAYRLTCLHAYRYP